MIAARSGSAAHAAPTVLVVVSTTCLLGIWSRASMPLASFWAANAVLLGLLVRWPSLRSPAAWAAAVGGYLFADLVTGNDLDVTLALTAANLTGPLVGVLIFDRLDDDDRRLQAPDSIVRLFLVALAASAAAAVPGALCGILFFELGVGEAYTIWLISEMAMYISLLPVLLSAPTARTARVWRAGLRATAWSLPSMVRLLGPAIAVSAAFAAAVAVGGPGSLMFCLPPLLWVALRASVFETACLAQTVVAANLLALAFMHDETIALEALSPTARASTQAGLATLALGPLIVAVSTGQRMRRLQEMEQIVERDELTNVLTRRAFLQQARAAVDRHRPTAVMMIDLDHFKRVNDDNGHATGDEVLRIIGRVLTSHVRASDLVGRMGGEEFALVLPGIESSVAATIAESLRVRCAEAVRSALGLDITLSIGLHDITGEDQVSLGSALAIADGALYEAKRSGRNQIVVR